MNKIYDAFKLPFATITNKPLYFIFWFVVLFFFGLLPLWFSLVKGFTEGAISCEWGLYLHNKGLTTFSIVILANSLANAFLAKESGMTDDTAVIRGIASALCILLLLFNAYFLSFPSSYQVYDRVNYLQLILFVFALSLAIYMYCFKDSKWEVSADSVRKEDDKATQQLDQDASNASEDKNGVKV